MSAHTSCKENRNILKDGKQSLNNHCHDDNDLIDFQKAKKTAKCQLVTASILVFIFMVAELVGGILANSLAIMTDAAHLMSDFTGFLISIVALIVAVRPPTKTMSFGYHRAEVIGALLSVILIWGLTVVLVALAITRIIYGDYEIDADIMLITASLGLVINIILGLVLHHSHHYHSYSHNHSAHDIQEVTNYEAIEVDQQTHIQKSKNINIQAAFIHVLGDLIQSVGVLCAAVIIKINPEWKIADPICTMLFSVLVILTTVGIVKDGLSVLMEAKPSNINYDEVINALCSISGVKMAHGLHIWSLTTDKAAIAVHLAVEDTCKGTEILSSASSLLKNRFGIMKTTIQIEEYKENIMKDCSECKGPEK